MRSIVELIAAKRDGGILSDDEIAWLIDQYATDRLPQYQMASMAMAVFFRGLDARETSSWTRAMLHSGEVLNFDEIGTARIDKHSTGGVGDKISLPLAPAAAACGVTVPMVSGRGLGHTGGTLDKLEAIPGYTVGLGVDDFRSVLAQQGCAMVGQTGEIAPADKRLYALRDVTATVESIPLITASIMSKKLAEGLDGLVLDVKVGGAAFMKTRDDARRLAESMVSVGEEMGKRVVAFLTRMEEPLGRMVGNACEVVESMETLSGRGPADVRELVVSLGGAMVELAHGVSFEDGKARIEASLDDGTAMDRWRAMVALQGGDLSGLPEPRGETPVLAARGGWVQEINGLEVGLCGVALGAGRTRADQDVDPIVGIRLDRHRGERVEPGEPIATILHGAQGAPSDEVVARLGRAFTLGSEEPEPTQLILERIG